MEVAEREGREPGGAVDPNSADTGRMRELTTAAPNAASATGQDETDVELGETFMDTYASPAPLPGLRRDIADTVQRVREHQESTGRR